MEATTPSRTALATALMRARHVRADSLSILDDPWGDRLVPAQARAAIYQMARVRNTALPQEPDHQTQQAVMDDYLRANPAYPNVILRSRYTEDALHRAVAQGTRQYLLIGAGFDSYALRRPPVAQSVSVIEIDHPATQNFKLQCMAAAQVAVPDLVRYMAADLSRQDLPSVLARSPMRAEEPAFFSWLGVTMYLTRQANQDTLRAIAAIAAPGSEIVFTYFDQVFFDQPGAASAAAMALRAEVASVGEPFVSGFHPATLAADLQPLGLRLLEDISDAGLARRYDPDNRNGFVATERSRIAHVRVEGLPRS
jgi:methyltransferase (TIGR00027 family)